MTNPTDTRALQALADKVEAGEVWGDMPRPQCLHTDLCWKAFNGSLDAAKALHEAVLPKWGWEICDDIPDLTAIIWPKSDPKKTIRGDRDYIDQRPIARCWLLAILRALIAGGRDGQA